jgi:ribosome modulation factor
MPGLGSELAFPSSELAAMEPDEILEAGISAYSAGVPRDACPYPIESDERRLWLEGWDGAKSVAEEED